MLSVLKLSMLEDLLQPLAVFYFCLIFLCCKVSLRAMHFPLLICAAETLGFGYKSHKSVLIRECVESILFKIQKALENPSPHVLFILSKQLFHSFERLIFVVMSPTFGDLGASFKRIKNVDVFLIHFFR